MLHLILASTAFTRYILAHHHHLLLVLLQFLLNVLLIPCHSIRLVLPQFLDIVVFPRLLHLVLPVAFPYVHPHRALVIPPNIILRIPVYGMTPQSSYRKYPACSFPAKCATSTS